MCYSCHYIWNPRIEYFQISGKWLQANWLFMPMLEWCNGMCMTRVHFAFICSVLITVSHVPDHPKELVATKERGHYIPNQHDLLDGRILQCVSVVDRHFLQLHHVDVRAAAYQHLNLLWPQHLYTTTPNTCHSLPNAMGHKNLLTFAISIWWCLVYLTQWYHFCNNIPANE